MDSRNLTLNAPRPLLLAMLVAGLVWLGFSSVQGLSNGHESDMHRRWKVAQYALAGVNPYPLAAAALEKTYGPFDDFRRTGKAVFAIPRLASKETTDPAARALLDRYGTPEATYPPSADLVLALTVGWLPENAVHLAGVVLNLALLAAIVLLLLPAGRMSWTAFTPLAGLFLLWAPTQSTVLTGQCGLLVLASLLLAVRLMAERPIAAGFLFALALIKPTLSLPFLILPLIRRRWGTLAVACGTHLGLMLVQSARFGCPPWELLVQWLDVGRYFMHCMYTLQEVLMRAGLNHTGVGWAIVIAFVVTAAGWCWTCRRAGDDAIFDLLCLVSLLWTQHLAYDFVLLFVPLVRVMSAARHGWRVVAIVSFVTISLGTSVWVYGDEQFAPWWFVRLATRGLLIAWLIGLAVRLRRASHSNRIGYGRGVLLPAMPHGAQGSYFSS